MIDKQVVFCHIPRTSGTAMKNNVAAIIEHTGVPGIRVKTTIDREVIAWNGPGFLKDVRFLAGHFGYGVRRYFDDPFMFTMLRDPIQRAISQYKFVMTTEAHYLHYTAMDMSLEEFATDPKTMFMVSNYQARYIAQSHDVCKMTELDWIGNSADLVGHVESFDVEMAQADYVEVCKKRLLYDFDFFCLSDRFFESLAFLLRRLELPVRMPKGKHVFTDHTEGLPVGTVKLLEDINRIDIQVFNYAQQLFEERLQDERSLSDHRVQHA